MLLDKNRDGVPMLSTLEAQLLQWAEALAAGPYQNFEKGKAPHSACK